MINVISGPTSSLKNHIVFEISKKKDIEIVNCDPFQMFKEIPLITNQPSNEIIAKNNVHFYGTKSIIEKPSLNVFAFQKEVRNLIDKLLLGKKDIFLVGGSGLYLNSVIKNYQFNFERTLDFKSISQQRYEEIVNDLIEQNPTKTIHFNNKKYNTLLWEKQQKKVKLETDNNQFRYETQIFLVEVEKNYHQTLIEERTEKMLKNGLIEEIKSNMKKIIENDLTKLIGFEECIKFLKNGSSRKEMKNMIVLRTLQLVKKQKTWFNKYLKKSHHIFINDYNSVQLVSNEILSKYMQNTV